MRSVSPACRTVHATDKLSPTHSHVTQHPNTPVTDPRELMRLHVEALYVHDADGRLLHVREPNGALAPRFFLGRTSDGFVCRVRHDVPHEVRRELEAVAEETHASERDLDAPTPASRFEEILARHAPIGKRSAGPAFVFPAALPSTSGTVHVTQDNAPLLDPLLQPWRPDVQFSQPLFAATADGQAVAVCGSVRITPSAHEAGVETAAPYRRRGYAVPVVAAWAQAVRELGVEPLYSTSWQNEASRAVARKLGLIRFGSDLSLT